MTRTVFRTLTLFLLLGLLIVLMLGATRFNPRVAAARYGCATLAFAVALPAANINQPYSATLLGSGGVGAYTFTRLSGALPDGISFNNGVFSGTPTQPGSFTVRIEAADENGCKGTEDFTLQVNCPTIDLSLAALAAGTYGTAYPTTTLNVTGGFAPYSFSVTGLPSGMTFSTTGSSMTIGGTPTQSGSFNVMIKVTDGFTCGNGAQGRSYALTINKAVLTVRAEDQTKVAGAPLPTLTHVINGFVNNDSVTAVSGAPALTTVATANSDAGTYPIIITQGSLAATHYDFSFVNGRLTVTCPTAATLPTSLPNGVGGTGYNAAVAASPSGTYRYSVTGNFPNGLLLNQDTGIISGTASLAGTFHFTITATRFGACAVSQSYVVSIACPVIDVLPKPSGLLGAAAFSLPAARSGQFYTTTISAASAGNAATFVLIPAPNVLPDGLTLNPATGVISGTTTAIGTYVFRVQVMAFGSCSGSRLYSLKVNAPI